MKKGFRVRFKNLPKSQEIYIRNLRSKHLGKFVAIEGIIRQSSEVRPQAVSARFECPSCGNMITMPQIDQQFREPSRCTCGRKGKFRLLSKELVDVQRLVSVLQEKFWTYIVSLSAKHMSNRLFSWKLL